MWIPRVSTQTLDENWLDYSSLPLEYKFGEILAGFICIRSAHFMQTNMTLELTLTRTLKQTGSKIKIKHLTFYVRFLFWPANSWPVDSLTLASTWNLQIVPSDKTLSALRSNSRCWEQCINTQRRVPVSAPDDLVGASSRMERGSSRSVATARAAGWVVSIMAVRVKYTCGWNERRKNLTSVTTLLC